MGYAEYMQGLVDVGEQAAREMGGQPQADGDDGTSVVRSPHPPYPQLSAVEQDEAIAHLRAAVKVLFAELRALSK